ncbi:tyrosine-type recombinase/integrase [Aestuariivirga litoralis]|uniref:tyrosine-type recombinase/integrase n=1 Tax=Aestuariivirga litoralis TaxID=2650924 RepID=UPI0018C5B444|nr:tyrosine-type recombinase/integrase [Aestuariivirga litoralis]MBG1233730.1 tyrosine-type recombinase/integrase [Aestuariivirga litoralis]
MGVVVRHLGAVDGRWKYRRTVKAELRPFIAGGIKEFVRSFGPVLTKNPPPEVLSRAVAAAEVFEKLLADAEARKTLADKQAAGVYDSITPAFAAHVIADLRARLYATDEQERFDPQHLALFGRLAQSFEPRPPSIGITPSESSPSQGAATRKEILEHVLAALREAYGIGVVPSGIRDTVKELCATRGLNVDTSSPAFHALTVEYLKLLIEGYEAGAARYAGKVISNPPAPPPFAPSALKSPSVVSLTALVEEWWKRAKAGGKSFSTYEARKRTVRQLVEFLGHDDAGRVTKRDIVRFRDYRILEKGINPLTVKDGDLPSISGLYSWAVDEELLPFNPTKGVKVPAKERADNRARDPGFSDEEAIALLRHASTHEPAQRESAHRAASKKWVHWLCAYTGARVGEMVQLRGQDVVQKDGHWIVVITPDAGTVKRGKYREVPLHPHLIEMGFPEFAKASGAGYLFTAPKSLSETDLRSSRRTAKNRLSDFARKAIKDSRVAPNHGWRHRFETLSRGVVGLHPAVSDKITGRKPAGESANYGFISIPDMAAAIAKFPRIDIDGVPRAEK